MVKIFLVYLSIYTTNFLSERAISTTGKIVRTKNKYLKPDVGIIATQLVELSTRWEILHSWSRY